MASSEPVWWVSLISYLLPMLLGMAIGAWILVSSKRPPAVKIAWILVVLAMPLIGALLYLTLGVVRMGRRNEARFAEILEALDALDAERGSDAPLGDADLPDELVGYAETAERFGARPLRLGNTQELFDDGVPAIDRLVADIDAAESSCHLLFYIWFPDGSGTRTGRALMAAARRGVDCRVVVDNLGSKKFLRSPLAREMREAGVEVVAGIPVRFWQTLAMRSDHRIHRKIVVIDGRIGYTGSLNMADAAFEGSKYAPWVDVFVRVEGPAVYDLQRVFLEDYLMEVDHPPGTLLGEIPEPIEDGVPMQVLGTGPLANHESLRHLTMFGMYAVRKDLLLTSPYFIPDEATTAALDSAARRGVRTRLILPRRNNQLLVGWGSKSYYDDLLDAGVEIYEYLPGLLHTKAFTFDLGLGVVSTANLDRRSYELNEEVSLFIYDPAFARAYRAVQYRYLEDCEPVDAEAFGRRRWPRRLLENAAVLLAPLL